VFAQKLRDPTNSSSSISGTTPWMRINDNFASINVAHQLASPTSIRSFYKQLIALRKREKALFIHGRHEVVDATNENTVCFVKHAVVDGKETGRVAVVVLNFTEEEQEFVLQEMVSMVKGRKMKAVVGNVEEGERKEGVLVAWEGRVYQEE